MGHLGTRKITIYMAPSRTSWPQTLGRMTGKNARGKNHSLISLSCLAVQCSDHQVWFFFLQMIEALELTPQTTETLGLIENVTKSIMGQEELKNVIAI